MIMTHSFHPPIVCRWHSYKMVPTVVMKCSCLAWLKPNAWQCFPLTHTQSVGERDVMGDLVMHSLVYLTFLCIWESLALVVSVGRFTEWYHVRAVSGDHSQTLARKKRGRREPNIGDIVFIAECKSPGAPL